MEIRGSRFKDLSGKKFERLTVVQCAGKNKRGNYTWECICECGTTKVVTSEKLINGRTRSCGCLRVENTTEMKTTHGKSKSRTYRIWSGMISRCYNEKFDKYKIYGGRGITVCDRWRHSFENFLEDMGEPPNPSLQIDRKDNNLGYYKENCHWVTRKQNMRNTRANVFVEHNGKKITIAELAEITGIEYPILRSRIQDFGWSVEDAIRPTLPAGHKLSQYKREDHV